MASTEEKHRQMADQCRAVAKLARDIASVHADLAKIWSPDSKVPLSETLIESVGKHTAERMELLGDMLNGMDAVSSRNKWMNPIFAKAHQIWPSKRSTEDGE